MRKDVFLATALALAFFSCSSSSVSYTPEKVASVIKQSYRKGCKEGFKEGYKKGYEEEGRRILASLKNFEKEVKASRIGKVLEEKGLLKESGEVYYSLGKEIRYYFDVSFNSSAGKLLMTLEVPELVSSGEEKKEKAKIPLVSKGLPPVQEVNYERGFKACYLKGYEKGVRKAREEALKGLREESEKVNFLLGLLYKDKEKMLTYPRVYRVKDRFIVFPPERMEITEEKLLSFKLPRFLQEGKNGERLQSITIPITSQSLMLPDTNVTDVVKVEVDCNLLQKAEKLGIDYEITEGKCRLVFFGKKSADDFCKRYKLCGKRAR